ncbi:MAG: DUF4190 domain-containing protein [Clostridia bacterium]|nr:DUF4190 domain-containing protein [Clostridia bacterium]
MFCNKCGTQNKEGDRFCINCGSDLQMQQPQPNANVVPNNNTYQYNQPYTYNQPINNQPDPGKGFAITSMIMGILSCLCCGSLLFAVLAIVFGAVAKGKGSRSGMAIAGIVCGIVAVVIFIVCLATGFSEGFLEGFMEGFDAGYYGYY